MSAASGWLASLLRCRRAVLALAGWSLLEGIPAFLGGRLVAHSVNDGFAAGRAWSGVSWLLGYAVVALVGAVGSRLVFHRLGDIVEPMRDELVCTVVRSVLHGDPTRSHQLDAAALARITRHIETVRDATAGLLVQARGLVVTAAAALAGLLSIAAGLAWLVLPPVLVAVACFAALLVALSRRQRTLVLADERCARSAGAVFSGLRDVQACGAHQAAINDIGAGIDEQATAAVRLGTANALRTLIMSLGGVVPLVLVLVVAPGMVAHGQISPGAVLGAVVYLTTNIQPALMALGDTTGSAVLRLIVTLRRLAEMGQLPDVPTGTAHPATFDVELRQLTYSWGSAAEPIVSNIDLQLAAGEHLAVVGASGIGKSTLAGLLTGLLVPDSGEVLLGGVPAHQLKPSARRRTITLIPQEAYVFAGTVRENLALLAEDATDAELTAAAEQVGAGPLLRRLGGLDAPIRHGGAELSAGERQLVALSRAYASNAHIMVLDEATSHLDPVAEARAELAFAARGGTLVVIAHRLSSALRARQVLMMDSGPPLVGSHDQLLARSPGYAALMRAWTGQNAIVKSPLTVN